MPMEQLSDLLNMNVEESMGKRDFTQKNYSVLMRIAWLCSPSSLN